MCALTGLGLTIALADDASAKDAAVIVLQHAGDQRVSSAALRAVEGAVRTRLKLNVVDERSLSSRLARKVRHSPSSASPPNDTLPDEAAELLEVVAFGRDEQAIQQGRAVLQREAQRLTVTNRSDRASHALADACLYVVRALQHRGDTAAAVRQAEECLLLVPDLAPSPETHPEPVRAAVAAARETELGELQVVGTAVSDCQVYIQGRPFGKLPARVRLVPGRYSVQTDCVAEGLIHEATVRPGQRTRLTVASRLEQALRPANPRLLYTEQNQGSLTAQDLSEYAEWLTLAELWTLQQAGEALRLSRFQVEDRRVLSSAFVLEPLEPRASLPRRLSRAAAKLSCDPAPCSEPAHQVAQVLPGRPIWIATGAVGAAGMLGSWILWTRYRAHEADLRELPYTDSRYSDRLDQRDDIATAAIISTAAGSGLFATAAPFWLPERQRVPWWAWTAGAVGAASAGVGTALWLRHNQLEQCDAPAGDEAGSEPVTPECRRWRSTLPLAPMLVTQGASLLSLPLTYLVRNWTRSASASLDVGATPSGLRLSWTAVTAGL